MNDALLVFYFIGKYDQRKNQCNRIGYDYRHIAAEQAK
jgi:hypothetical protein